MHRNVNKSGVWHYGGDGRDVGGPWHALAQHKEVVRRPDVTSHKLANCRRRVVVREHHGSQPRRPQRRRRVRSAARTRNGRVPLPLMRKSRQHIIIKDVTQKKNTQQAEYNEQNALALTVVTRSHVRTSAHAGFLPFLPMARLVPPLEGSFLSRPHQPPPR